MRHLAALIFDGFELLDLFGPLEMFGLLDKEFRIELVAESGGPVRSGQQVAAHATRTLDEGRAYDLLLVPGGPGTRREVGNARLLEWIAGVSAQAEYTMSVCTGSALLARAGVLDGRRATTNKAAFTWVESQGPTVNWVKRARWVEDGRVLTSSGVSAGMDMALGAIALMHGTERAEEVASWAEYTWQRDRSEDPFAARHGLV